MDPLTHGVIGLALSTFSGQPVAVDNPIAIGCALGAMAPDLDIVLRVVKDDTTYMKHHRGKSHSVPALLAFSVVITAGLSFVFKDMSVSSVFLWTMVGALSHTLFDILNSYGAMLLKKKKRMNLLTLYDPVITVLAIYLIASRHLDTLNYSLVAGIFAIYILSRLYMRKKVKERVDEHYGKTHEIKDITIMPGLKAFYKWDFIVESESHSVVGRYNLFNRKVYEIKTFERSDSEMTAIFNRSNVGGYFAEFTPNYHVIHYSENDKTIVKAIDLRYHLKDEFMHHATLVLDENRNIMESYFHPYNLEKRLVFNETN